MSQDELDDLASVLLMSLAQDPDSSSSADEGEGLDEVVQSAIHYLATTYPCPAINRLMLQVWNLVGTCTIPMVVAPIKRPTIISVRVRSLDRAAFVFPPSLLRLESTLMVGAIVACSSQAVDLYNNQTGADGNAALARAMAYEAEYLLTARLLDPLWEPTEYQHQLMDLFPQGTQTPIIAPYLYTPKDLDSARSRCCISSIIGITGCSPDLGPE